MVLSDFLSRQKNNNSNPHEIIPISFNTYKILNDNYYNVEKYCIQMRSQARSSGIKLPEIHEMRKNLDPNINQKNNMPFPNKEVQRSCAQVREELDSEGKDLIPSINQLSSHQTCHRKFLEEQK